MLNIILSFSVWVTFGIDCTLKNGLSSGKYPQLSSQHPYSFTDANAAAHTTQVLEYFSSLFSQLTCKSVFN